VHFPVGGEETVDIVFGEEIRGAVGAVDDPQGPVISQLWLEHFRQYLLANYGWLADAARVQYIAAAQGAAAVPAKFSQRKSAA